MVQALLSDAQNQVQMGNVVAAATAGSQSQ
jgi:hypothetical protein